MSYLLLTDEALYEMEGDEYLSKLSHEPIIRDGSTVGRKTVVGGKNLLVLDTVTVNEPKPLIRSKPPSNPIPSLTIEASELRALKDTFFKSRPIGSKDLPSSEVILLKQGATLSYKVYRPDINQHAYVETASGHAGYIFVPHWSIPKKQREKELKLPVIYSSQRDNWDAFQGPGWRQCRLTSYYMMADFLLNGEIKKAALAKGYKEGEDLYGEVLATYGDTTEVAPHKPTLSQFGIEGYFTQSSSTKDVLLALDLRVPVPLGLAYRASGHWVCAVGYNDAGVFVHDPFGVRIGMTDEYENIPGDYDFYSWDFLQAKFVDMGNEAGFAYYCTSVRGKTTGLPLGL